MKILNLFLIFFNLMKYVSFEILWKYWNFLNIEIFLKNRFVWKFWNFITPLPIIINIYWTPSLPMVFWPPYPWYIDPPTHGILTPLTMVYWPPYPWYIDLPNPWYINPPTHGISSPLLWYYELLSFGRNEGGSIYHEGVQNTMTKNWPRG
jgi:hypothetical protein